MDQLTLAEKERDAQYWEEVISSVDAQETGWAVSGDIGTLWVQDLEGAGFAPEVGMVIRFYGRGFGYQVRGVDINGATFRYQTEAQLEAEHQRNLIESQNRQKADFAAKRGEYEAAYKVLPAVFQQRIDRFRANNPDFNFRFLGYELFCCTEAMKIAEGLATEEAIEQFGKMSYEEQKAALPALDYDNHSGNTFGCARILARLYVSETQLVAQWHGALCPLVGCREYGCKSAEECDEAEAAKEAR